MNTPTGRLTDGSGGAAFRSPTSVSSRMPPGRSFVSSRKPSSPGGEIHVRRLPHPERLETAYADVMYRRTPLKYSAPLPGRASMTLHPCDYDPIAALEPEILGAHFMVSDVYGGGFGVGTED